MCLFIPAQIWGYSSTNELLWAHVMLQQGLFYIWYISKTIWQVDTWSLGCCDAVEHVA